MNALQTLWTLDPAVTFLNHGSFGATPRAVLEAQREWQARMEREPVRFFVDELDVALGASRAALAPLLHCKADDLAFVSNATSGVNTVLRSLSFEPGDELLCTDHIYPACKNVLDFVASRTGAQIVVAKVPFPCTGPEEVIAAVMGAVSGQTRLVLLDQVASPTGLVFPVPAIVKLLSVQGIDTLVDAAHGPGIVPLNLDDTGAAYTTGNCHKWMCAPKGCAFLHVRSDRQTHIRPLTISHGATTETNGNKRFRAEFDWVGTADPSPYLTVPFLNNYMQEQFGNWDHIMATNRNLAILGRTILCEKLGIEKPCPDSMVAALASLPLPKGFDWAGQIPRPAIEVCNRLYQRWRVEVPIFDWPQPGKQLFRISAQLYNDEQDYLRLAEVLAGSSLGYVKADCSENNQ
ncbi:MAG: aminotransferase class V-fold PLP-dependent enzyme [Myxococcales bacterium]|nr:aminotransferase class V-fold PLP-dependent enzyme [Myxococcales bacterium]